MSYRLALRKTATVLLALALVGCKAAKEPDPVMVKGRIEYAGGMPVVNMVLIFYPLDDTRNRKTPSFVSDREGRFQDLILPGRYKATLAALPQMSSSGPVGGRDVFPPRAGQPSLPWSLARYRDRGKSPWEIIIPMTGHEDLLLTVK